MNLFNFALNICNLFQVFTKRIKLILQSDKIKINTNYSDGHFIRDGNGLDLMQDPRDSNPIGSDLGLFKMNLDQI